jgi:hypothetical protein
MSNHIEYRIYISSDKTDKKDRDERRKRGERIVNRMFIEIMSERGTKNETSIDTRHERKISNGQTLNIGNPVSKLCERE